MGLSANTPYPASSGKKSRLWTFCELFTIEARITKNKGRLSLHGLVDLRHTFSKGMSKEPLRPHVPERLPDPWIRRVDMALSDLRNVGVCLGSLSEDIDDALYVIEETFHNSPLYKRQVAD